MKDQFEVERFEHAGRTVVISLDYEASNPRTEFYNVATLYCWHRRANLGDKQIRMDGFASAEDVLEHIKEEAGLKGDKILAVLPLHLYEHSGMTMSVGAFGDRFDSGQVGWGIVLASTADAAGIKSAKHRSRKVMEELIESEVRVYDRYLTGRVYGFEVLGRDGDHLDSCWGFYDEIEYVRSEARTAAEYSDDPKVTEAANELASRPTFAGIPDRSVASG